MLLLSLPVECEIFDHKFCKYNFHICNFEFVKWVFFYLYHWSINNISLIFFITIFFFLYCIVHSLYIVRWWLVDWLVCARLWWLLPWNFWRSSYKMQVELQHRRWLVSQFDYQVIKLNDFCFLCLWNDNIRLYTKLWTYRFSQSLLKSYFLTLWRVSESHQTF